MSLSRFAIGLVAVVLALGGLVAVTGGDGGSTNAGPIRIAAENDDDVARRDDGDSDSGAQVDDDDDGDKPGKSKGNAADSGNTGDRDRTRGDDGTNGGDNTGDGDGSRGNDGTGGGNNTAFGAGAASVSYDAPSDGGNSISGGGSSG